MGVLFVKLIGEVGVVVDMSLAAFVVVCVCERAREREGERSLVFGEWRSEKGGSGTVWVVSATRLEGGVATLQSWALESVFSVTG
ncbi:hypothetical protein FH972_014636 [Carpinus fangiana]|uniref:Uncharacterized protein n=1 Tax=Carpinus fangiana TaxID=176857 RepID=A0A5N6RDK1_9ROSI|nr:hypothetical protein FH972_014636 [Carpinus fangiana]